MKYFGFYVHFPQSNHGAFEGIDQNIWYSNNFHKNETRTRTIGYTYTYTSRMEK